MTPRTKHILGVAATIATGIAVELFGPSGPWAHVACGGLVVALLTQVKTALGGVS